MRTGHKIAHRRPYAMSQGGDLARFRPCRLRFIGLLLGAVRIGIRGFDAQTVLFGSWQSIRWHQQACLWDGAAAGGSALGATRRVRPGRAAAVADRPDPARRFRPGLQFRLAHHRHAEGVSADAFSRDRRAHRTSDRSLRGHRFARRLAGSAEDRPHAARRAQPERRRASSASDAGRRSRSQRRRFRRVRLLCRRCGAPFPGPARARGRRQHSRADAQAAQRAGASASRAASHQCGHG